MNNLELKLRKAKVLDTITVRYRGDQEWEKFRKEYVINKKPFDTVLISMGGMRIPAHRNFLAARSTFFESLFDNDMNLSEIRLENIGGKSLKPIIKYYYGERVHIGAHNVGKIIMTSSHLHMLELSFKCVTYLKKPICMSNCLILFDFADYYNLTDISMNAFKFILFNIADLMDDKKFLVMTTKLMTQIMLKPYLEIPSEEYIIIKFIEWVKYDLENRASEAIELLKLVKPTLVRRKLLKAGIKCIKDMLRDGSISSEEYAMYINTIDQDYISKKVNYIGEGATEQLLAIGINYDYSFNLEVYNNVTKTWEVEWASVSLGENFISNFHVVFQQSEIYILCEGFKDSFFRSFDKRKICKELRPMNIWRREYSTVSDGRYIFVVGGYNEVPALHCVERYDFVYNHWFQVAPTIHPHRSPGLIEVNGIIFVFGGSNNTVEYYNPNLNEWQVLPPMRFSRCYPTVVYSDNRIFILGGSISNEVEVFDVQQMKWSEFPIHDMPPLTHMTHTTTMTEANITTGATFNDRLILFERFYSSLSFQYILSRNDWTGFKKLRHHYMDLSIITARSAFFD